MAYQRRIVDQLLDDLFPALAAIALEGAKGVGKTATASQRATTVLALENPGTREIVANNTDHIAQLPPPVLIDEWQLQPTVWNRVRRAVDDNPTGGRFLLAGSAAVAPDVPIHSGAGRIVSIVMRPLSVAERGLAQPTVSLASLLRGGALAAGQTTVRLPDYVDEILRSGFPGIRGLPPRARTAQLDSYLARVVERELLDNGVSVRRPAILRAWLAAYGAATATTTSYTKILVAATPGEADKPARGTVDGYRAHLQRLFLLDPVPAWTPSPNTLVELTYAPKHHLIDPALAARLARSTRAGLLNGDGARIASASGTWLGALFESLVAQSVRVYAQASDATVGHLRTKNGRHEVDLIVEGDDRSVVAIEVKLAATVSDADVRHLHWLRERLGERMINGIIVTAGEYAYRRNDGIVVVPLALLGP